MLRFAAFIREVDSWFDVLNSNSLYHSHKPLNTAYRSVYIFSSYFWISIVAYIAMRTSHIYITFYKLKILLKDISVTHKEF